MLNQLISHSSLYKNHLFCEPPPPFPPICHCCCPSPLEESLTAAVDRSVSCKCPAAPEPSGQPGTGRMKMHVITESGVCCVLCRAAIFGILTFCMMMNMAAFVRNLKLYSSIDWLIDWFIENIHISPHSPLQKVYQPNPKWWLMVTGLSACLGSAEMGF